MSGSTVLFMNTWTRDIDDWTTYLAAANTPATTLSLRTYHLRRAAAGLGGSPRTVTFDDLAAWLAGQSWAANTRKSYRQSLRSFYGWAMATGRVSESPAHLLPPVRVPRGKPRPTPEPVYQAALREADARTWLAIRLGGAMGLRRGEIAKARREDLERDLTGWSLRVAGKGGHVRIVPAPDDVSDAILNMPAGWLFPSPHGGHLTPHYLAKLISKALHGHGTHTLRHRCGSTAYAQTKDLRAVQELLGHAKPETTAIYTLVPNDDVRAAMQAAA